MVTEKSPLAVACTKILDVQDWHRVIAVITDFLLLPVATERCPSD